MADSINAIRQLLIAKDNDIFQFIEEKKKNEADPEMSEYYDHSKTYDKAFKRLAKYKVKFAVNGEASEYSLIKNLSNSINKNIEQLMTQFSSTTL